jgi:hypothetical protein
MAIGAPAQVSTKHTAANVGATTSFSLPSTPTAGSTVLVGLATYNGSSGGVSGVTVGGQAAVRDVRSSTGVSQTSIWRVSNFSGASGSVIVTHGSGSGNYTTGAAGEWGNLRLAPLDKSGTFTYPNSTANIVATTPTLAATESLIFGLHNPYQGLANNGFASLAGQTDLWLEQNSSATQGGACAYKVATTTAAQTLSWSHTAASDGEGCYATYMEVEPPPPPTVDRLVGLDTNNAQRSVGLATTSAGAADAGKVPRLNASGVLDSSITGGPSGGGLNKAALLALSAANAFHRNCRTRGLHPAPPMITVGTSTAPSGHTRTYTFGAAGHPFAHSGGNPSTSSGRTTFPVRGANAFAWRVDVVHDGDSVAFLLDSVTADGYRFLVDGQYVSTSSTTSAAGSERYFRLQFTTKARRRITVEGNPGLGFWGAATTDDGQCIRPADAASGNALYVGDSNPEMVGFNQKGDSCALAFTDHLGFRGCWINASSGSGFVVAGSSTNYAGRRGDWTTAVADDLFDLIVFQCSYNDRAQTTASVKSAVAAEIAAARTKHPNAVILVHGNNSWNHIGSDVTDLTNTEAAAAEAVTEAADPLIGFIPIYTHAAGTAGLPIIGTSAVGDAGTGNTPRYVSHAADHMNPAGNIYFGQWLARRVIEKLAAMGGIDVPALDAPDSVPSAFTVEFSAPGTFSGNAHPPGEFTRVEIVIVPAGGGGGSGRKGTTAENCFGGGGGCGSLPAVIDIPVSLLPNPYSVTVGAGGVGGAARTTNSTNGANGTAGGQTGITSVLLRNGGAAGTGGTNAAGATGTATTGFILPGISLSSCTGGAAQASSAGADGQGASQGTRREFPTGGGGGGTISSGPNPRFGGRGGPVDFPATNFALGGAGSSSNPAVAGTTYYGFNYPIGLGGGGGTASGGVGNRPGANGGWPGGGGGGGSGGTDGGTDSGAGGNGGDGYVRLRFYK